MLPGDRCAHRQSRRRACAIRCRHHARRFDAAVSRLMIMRRRERATIYMIKCSPIPPYFTIGVFLVLALPSYIYDLDDSISPRARRLRRFLGARRRARRIIGRPPGPCVTTHNTIMRVGSRFIASRVNAYSRFCRGSLESPPTIGPA